MMLLPAKQKIRFRGRNGEVRAANLARELQGRCKVSGCEVELTEDTEFSPRVFSAPSSFPSATPFRTDDFRP